MSARYTQSKQEAAEHTSILKAMLKLKDNKTCADCKRNDPRWASTNLGCFMCIRCSGIHRGMGVHITRIKSVDLDTWTPEQIVLIQRWGNKRANAYWEAHLKAGHAPPEHKMESFIRSKYESKRWAMDGPVPEPESLDSDQENAPAASTSSTIPVKAATRAPPTTSIDLLAGPPLSNFRAAAPSPPIRSAPAIVTPPVTAVSSGGGLFDLDFSAPPPAPTPKRDAKADILSLFASAPPMSSNASSGSGSFYSGSANGLSQGMGALNLGGDTGGWGAPAPVQSHSSAAFGGFSDFSAPVQPPAPRQRSGTEASNPWGSTANATNDAFGDFSNGTDSSTTKKLPDAFSDIWS